jgi:hypothetical protein
MPERRRLLRNRVYYGGLLAFNAGRSTLACIVRDFSPFGAKIEFEDAAILPYRVEFIVERQAICYPARLVWRKPFGAGLAFDLPEANAIVSLESVRQQRDRRRQQRSRIDDFDPDPAA